jgi:hypothetical protein
VLVVATGYFFYAGSSIDPTGPVYYLPLMPLLIAWTAMVAVDLDATAAWLRRAVPTFLCAQGVAALLVFWPAQVRSLMRDIDHATECETMIDEAGIKRGLVFAVTLPAYRELSSWHRLPPLTEPPFDAPVLWARPFGTADDLITVKRFAGDRPVFLATCFGLDPTLNRYDPEHKIVRSLDGKQEKVITPEEEARWLRNPRVSQPPRGTEY